MSRGVAGWLAVGAQQGRLGHVVALAGTFVIRLPAAPIATTAAR